MPLSLNLYHEIQAQELERKRDPLKLGLLALGVVLLGFVGFWFVKWNGVRAEQAKLRQTERDLKELEPKLAEARQRRKEIETLLATRDKIKSLQEGRIYWAPVLQELFANIPPNVQVRNLNGTSELKVPPASQPTAKTTLHVTLRVAGIAAGPEPRTIAENLRRSLEKRFTEAYPEAGAEFTNNQLEDTGESVELNGTRLPTARFSIDVAASKEFKP